MKEEQVQQLVEVEQLTKFSSKLVEGGFFYVKGGSLDVPISIPTKFWFKYMMKHKGEKHVEDGNSLTKVTRKWTLVESKEIQEMLQWI
jgi:hypothetical protein